MSKKTTRQLNKKGRYYLIVVKGVDNQIIFPESDDYQFFLSLFGYLLPKDDAKNLIGYELSHYGHEVKPVSYCLLPSECEMLAHCLDGAFAGHFVNDLMMLYAAYFYSKYNQKMIDNHTVELIEDLDLLAVSRRIHIKPPQWRTYEYSSLRAYLYRDNYGWLDTNSIAESWRSALEYLEFLES